MSEEAPVRVNRRQAPRYVIYRDCSIIVMGTPSDVTLLNVCKNGVAVLGSETDVAVGDRIEVIIDGFFPHLEAIVVNVNYGRIGAKFDLVPEIAAVWEDEFAQMIEGLVPLE